MPIARASKIALASTAVAAFGLAAFLAGRALAGGIPATAALTYSGTLEDATGAPLAGSHNIQVIFWSAASAGTNVCPQTTSTSIALDGGRFTYPLPDTCTAAVKASPDVWSEVLVDGSSLGRTKIGAVPYAVEAGHSTNADNATTATTATTASGTLASTISSLQTSVTQMQSDIAALKNDFGAAYFHSTGHTSITSSNWTWVGGTPAIDAAAGERLFVWNTGAVFVLSTSGGAACPGCISYSDAYVAACYIQNGDTSTPHLGTQTVVSNPVAGVAADIAFSVADYFTFTPATANVQVGLCARTLADNAHLDFSVDYPGTIVLRAPVHGP